MATLAAIKSAANARLAVIWPIIKARQAIYAANHGGNYWQGIITPGAPPDDGALCSPNYALAPSDQFDYTPPVYGTPAKFGDPAPIITPAVKTYRSWNWLGIALPATVEFQAFCDVYGAPGGIYGYRFTILLTKAGIKYSRTGWVEDGVERDTGAWAAV